MTPSLLDAHRPADILRAATILRSGGAVVIPTDTLYGLAASILRPGAVERVFEIKRRPPEKRVPVLIATAADLPMLAHDVPRVAWKLIASFWPGQVTLVLPARPTAPPALTRDGDTVALRVPAARTTLELLQTLGEPVVGTSANISGQPPIMRGADALHQLPGVDAVLVDDGAIVAGEPSTVVDLTGDIPVITRVGAVRTDAIREALGTRVRVGTGSLTGGPDRP
jgi:L-threonylcarbamoyladenylate synthase